MFKHLPNYKPASPSLWQGRTDTQNPERFFQFIDFVTHESQLINIPKQTVFLGFASDIGIIRNLGRPGAYFGPDEIKTQLAKLPSASKNRYLDLGTIDCTENLESCQSQFAQIIDFCHQHGHRTIAFGGGHEIAWGHYQGLAGQYKKIGIINFDAHFDLRPYQFGELGTSGTPFSQIADFCKLNNQTFNYCCLGIQHCGNTQSLFKRAAELNVDFLNAEQMQSYDLAQQISFLNNFIQKVDHIYLSICLDVFAECFAPGVSAPQPLGINPWHAVPLLKYIMQTGKVVSIDLAELSPPLDQNQKTARLAALITAELLDI